MFFLFFFPTTISSSSFSSSQCSRWKTALIHTVHRLQCAHSPAAPDTVPLLELMVTFPFSPQRQQRPTTHNEHSKLMFLSAVSPISVCLFIMLLLRVLCDEVEVVEESPAVSPLCLTTTIKSEHHAHICLREKGKGVCRFFLPGSWAPCCPAARSLCRLLQLLGVPHSVSLCVCLPVSPVMRPGWQWHGRTVAVSSVSADRLRQSLAIFKGGRATHPLLSSKNTQVSTQLCVKP